MPVVAIPDIGIPLPVDTTPEELEDFREKAKAFVQTIEDLEDAGLEINIADEDRIASHQMLAEEKVAPARSITPAAIKHLNAILSEYDREVLDVHTRLRAFITNKLIIETNDTDARTRLKALEMLGKISGVGLFAERIDVSVTHRTVQDIEEEIRKTLDLAASEYEDVTDEEEIADSTAIAAIDVDAELGTTPDNEEAETETDES